MNRAYVQHREDSRIVGPAYAAADGLALLGYEVIWFTRQEFEAGLIPITRDTLVVGYIDTWLKSLDKLGIARPANMDLPEELAPFFGRKVWPSTLQVARRVENWPIFIKPREDHKAFTGRLISVFRDLFSSAYLPMTTPVLCSEPVSFVSEYRCFVYGNDIVDVRHYRGNPLIFPDGDVIAKMNAAWKSRPVSCCIDAGVTNDGRTLLVEVNDGHSMGDYGLDTLIYARMLEARWCEITGAKPIP